MSRMLPALKLFVAALLTVGSAFGQNPGFGGGSSSDPFALLESLSGAVQGASLRPWVSVNGGFMRTLNETSQFANQRPPVGTASAGIGGSKRWRMKQLVGGYTASVSFNPTSVPNLPRWRPTQAGNLSYSQQVTQRLSFSLSQMAGLSYNGYGVGSGFGAAGVTGNTLAYGPGGYGDGTSVYGDPGINGVVDNEILAGRALFYASSGSLNYMFSERLAVSFSGNFATVKRDQGIRGSRVVGGSAQLSYRLSRRSSVFTGGSYTTNSFSGMFGNVQSLSSSVGLSYAFSPTVTASIYGGAGQMRSNFIGLVALPPEVAAVLGVPGTLEVMQSTFWAPTYGVSVSKRAEIGAFAFSFNRGFGMGNGVVMAGVRDLATMSFSRSLGSKASFSLQGSAVRNSGRVGVQRTTETLQGGASLGYPLVRGLSVGLNGGVRYVGIPSHSHRSDAYVGIGLSWSPGVNLFVF